MIPATRKNNDMLQRFTLLPVHAKANLLRHFCCLEPLRKLNIAEEQKAKKNCGEIP